MIGDSNNITVVGVLCVCIV